MRPWRLAAVVSWRRRRKAGLPPRGRKQGRDVEEGAAWGRSGDGGRSEEKVEEDCGNARRLVEKKRERENEESGEIKGLRLLGAANEEKKNGKEKSAATGSSGWSGDGEESEGEGERGSPERGPSFNFAGIS
ncbi:hypothetical protein OIU76_013834 [Salix suchowensis]|nr:hypothetical protein OIU76_013834 [Salix suchowensis]